MCRTLDISAYLALTYGPLTKSILDTNMQSRESVELYLQPPELLFLLENLKNRLHKRDHVSIYQ